MSFFCIKFSGIGEAFLFFCIFFMPNRELSDEDLSFFERNTIPDLPVASDPDRGHDSEQLILERSEDIQQSVASTVETHDLVSDEEYARKAIATLMKLSRMHAYDVTRVNFYIKLRELKESCDMPRLKKFCEILASRLLNMVFEDAKNAHSRWIVKVVDPREVVQSDVPMVTALSVSNPVKRKRFSFYDVFYGLIV